MAIDKFNEIGGIYTGKVISVSAFKGGVGKTTSATNIAAALKKLQPDSKILLVDLDFQSNATMAFNYVPEELKGTIYEAIHREINIQDVILHHDSGIDIIPANFDLCAFDIDIFKNEKGIFPESNRPYILKDLLDPLKSKYDYIVCDAGPSLSMMAVNYMVMTDHFLVTLQMGRFALTGAIRLIEYIKDVRDSYCPNLQYKTDMFATFFDSRTNVSSDVLQEARKYCSAANIGMAEAVISKTIRFENSQAYNGVPLVLVENSEYSQQYINLTKELIING